MPGSGARHDTPGAEASAGTGPNAAPGTPTRPDHTAEDGAGQRVSAATGDDAETWRDLATVVHSLARRLKPRTMALARVSALSPTTAAVLRAVVNRPGINVHEIAAETVLQQSNVSAAVAELSRHGLVIKTADPDDRRRVLVHPTSRAIDQGRRIEEAWASLYGTAIAGLDDADVRRLRESVRALTILDARLACLDEHAD